MRKSHFNDEFLVLSGPIISSLFTCSNAEKNKIKKTKDACSSPISMLYHPITQWMALPIPSISYWISLQLYFLQREEGTKV
jgi:hypothetical protein